MALLLTLSVYTVHIKKTTPNVHTVTLQYTFHTLFVFHMYLVYNLTNYNIHRQYRADIGINAIDSGSEELGTEPRVTQSLRAVR